ncbi:hypothetical protein Q5752_002135 [Cryptotrichosporon argae]
MGIRTVAVYSDADAGAQHVMLADEAYRLGPAAASESYLKGDEVLRIARECGANAIHPGYGFLSESPTFARLVQDAGIGFVGPPASAIESMGSKRVSKQIMLAAGVPCVPGYHGPDQSPARLAAEAEQIGFPVLIKPVHGGGGKGMRVSRSASDFADELAASQREARKSFGNNDVLLERWLERPRHIEVQVFADGHGACVSLSERDCSVQRRHQKIIEEAPAPELSEDLRKELADKAVAAAKAVDYVGAGTVEFIMDTKTRQFYFMEMNTRLQVEHPVTELITGVDLVQWQLLIAGGAPLPITQDQVQRKGHAIEARIYAERPEANFLPDAGRLVHVATPSGQYRLDTGVVEGDEVSSYYDPMIAKLVVHGQTRNDALAALDRALGEYQIVGPSTNVKFIQTVVNHPAFKAGPVETSFIPTHHDELFKPVETPDEVLVQAALSLVHPGTLEIRDVWHTLHSRRFTDSASRTFHVCDRAITVRPRTRHEPGPAGYDVTIGGATYAATCAWQSPTELVTHTLGAHGARHVSTVVAHHEHLHVFTAGTHYTLHVARAVVDDASGPAARGTTGTLRAPMPSTVVDVRVAPGDAVREGQVCVVLESMKMEMIIRADRDGTVGALGVAKGQVVAEGDELVVLEPEAEAE